AGLGRITPGVPVVGEEADATDPSRLDALRGTDRVWVVDALDGTGNFVAGSPEWAVMVALIEGGSAIASWVWQPVSLRMFIAERGSGATANGAMLRVRDRGQGGLRGAVLTRFLDPATAATVDRNIGRIEEVVPGRLCSGYEYPAIIEGEADFVLFWRTHPWDHAPGCLLLEEAGGVARRPDGTVYQPGADGVGLLVASGP